MGRAGDPGSAHACDMLCSRVLYCTSTLYTTVLNSLYTVRCRILPVRSANSDIPEPAGNRRSLHEGRDPYQVSSVSVECCVDREYLARYLLVAVPRYGCMEWFGAHPQAPLHWCTTFAFKCAGEVVGCRNVPAGGCTVYGRTPTLI